VDGLEYRARQTVNRDHQKIQIIPSSLKDPGMIQRIFEKTAAGAGTARESPFRISGASSILTNLLQECCDYTYLRYLFSEKSWWIHAERSPICFLSSPGTR
jgi:hypothetical protein